MKKPPTRGGEVHLTTFFFLTAKAIPKIDIIIRIAYIHSGKLLSPVLGGRLFGVKVTFNTESLSISCKANMLSRNSENTFSSLYKMAFNS